MKQTKKLLLRISLMGLALMLTSCGSLKTKSGRLEGGAVTPVAKTEDSVSNGAGVVEDASAVPTEDVSDTGADLANIPEEMNEDVQRWVDYFQGRGRQYMERYLARSTRYIPMMKAILKKEGLPEDLVYIALIESGFSSTAHSSASAVGYWQFIRGTGRRYGLEISSYVDERRDFVKSTQAAADYFKGLYNLFGSWYLAIASYNTGENKIKRMIMRYNTRDFWQLAKSRRLPTETKNYVPKFIAARIIARNPEKFGFIDIDYQEPLAYDEIQVTKNTDLRKMASQMNLQYEDLRALNPSYKKGVAFAKGILTLRVPVGAKETGLVAAQASVADAVTRYVAASDDDIALYRVRPGDTISGIAKKFRTSAKRIRDLNRIGSRGRIIAGRKIKVPDNEFVNLHNERLPASSKKRMNTLKNRKSSSARIYIVRRGDTLTEIARRYNVRMGELLTHNQMRRHSKIAIGTRLSIPD